MNSDLIKRNHDEACEILGHYFCSIGYNVVQINGSKLINKVDGLVPDMVLEKNGAKIAVEYGSLNGGEEKIPKLLMNFDKVFHIPRSDLVSYVFVYDKISGGQITKVDLKTHIQLKKENAEIKSEINNFNVQNLHYERFINTLFEEIKIFRPSKLIEWEKWVTSQHISRIRGTIYIGVVKCKNCQKEDYILQKKDGKIIHKKNYCGYCAASFVEFEKIKDFGFSFNLNEIEFEVSP